MNPVSLYRFTEKEQTTEIYIKKISESKCNVHRTHRNAVTATLVSCRASLLRRCETRETGVEQGLLFVTGTTA